MNPVAHAELYDKIVLAGRASPGACTLSSPMREFGWDKQTAKGTTGATTVRTTGPLLEFEVSIYLGVYGVPEQSDYIDEFALWDAWKGVLATPVKDGAEKALDIYHPQLEGLGLRSVVVKGVTEPQPDGKGGATVKIKFLEYRPAVKNRGTGQPNGSASQAGKKAKDTNDPNADLKAQVKKLTEQYQRAG